ncbi:MAG TPA: GTP 3',8-cyclase MoaA [Acidimicrobiales bacterium]|nr:GTP 3',8-cyclase MoaA [Acidimicrobiales bacterium]
MSEALVDPFGRRVRDLRISVTDRCNLRCRYCMPAEGLEWLPRSDLLSFEEITRVARVCVERFGFGSIRLTGGEPTVRAHLDRLVAALAGLRSPAGDPVDLALTTNGTSLALIAADLRRAGLRRVNISLDSLRPERFVQLTRRDALQSVLEGIDAALAAGFAPVKVNCVLVRGVNDDEVVEFAAFGRERGIVVRFIEFMPLDADRAWSGDQVVPAAQIVEAVGAVWPLEPVGGRGASPAERFRYRDGAGEIGVIGSVTSSFCGDCDRVRLTAEGMFRNCLFAVDETDLRAVLRRGGSDDDLAAAIVADVGRKWAGHSIGQVTFLRPDRSMSQIGG